MTDVAEEWMGGTLQATTVGDNPIYYAVGGINARGTFGLGVWNVMVWGMDEAGIALTATTNAYGAGSFGAGWTAMAVAGQSASDIAVVKVPNASTGILALSVANSNNCMTYVEQSLTGWDTHNVDPMVSVAAFAGSVTTCVDWATDGFSVSGVPALFMFTKVLTLAEATAA